MRDQGIPCNYLRLDERHQVKCGELSFDEVFNSLLPNDELQFLFESRYEPFGQYVHDDLKPIDLVVKSTGAAREFLRPLEIKLTTLPDNTTANLSEEHYGCELVIRNPTTRYIALSIAHSCSGHFPEMREILDPVCHAIRNWDNLREMLEHKTGIFQALEGVISRFQDLQQPLLM